MVLEEKRNTKHIALSPQLPDAEGSENVFFE